MMDNAWSTFIASSHLVDDVLPESRQAVLAYGDTFWTHSETLNTAHRVVLFNKDLGVPIMSSKITY